MSRTGRAPLSAPVAMTRPLRGLGVSYPDGHVIPRHRHRAAQLVYAVSGVMRVTTPEGSWVVPPQRAVWVPANVSHTIRMTGQVEMRTIYLAPRLAGALPRCSVVQVTPLLRELVLRVVELPPTYPAAGPEARLARVLVDELRAAPVAPLHLPLPSDPRALRLARALEAAPGDPRSLERW